MKNLIVIAQQFRTPLQTIDGFLTLLLDEELPDSIKKKLILIQECTNYQTSVMKKLIALSLLEEKSDTSTNTVFNLRKVLKKCICANEDHPNNNSIVISKINHCIELYGNEKSLKQLIQIVLNNACSYTTNGTVEIIPEIEIDEKNASEIMLVISFVDSKTGVDQLQKNKLYQSKLLHVTKYDVSINFDSIALQKVLVELNAQLRTNINHDFDTLTIEIPFIIL